VKGEAHNRHRLIEFPLGDMDYVDLGIPSHLNVQLLKASQKSRDGALSDQQQAL